MIYLSIEQNAGIGNQFFQYARAYAAAKRYQQEICIYSFIGRADCIREYVLDRFCLDESVVKKVKRADRLNIFKHKSFKGANALNKLLRKQMNNEMQGMIEQGKVEPHILNKDQNRAYVPDVALLQDRDYYFEGFSESFKYFYDFKDEIQDQLRLKQLPKEASVLHYADRMEQSDSVAVHIRWGDFASTNRMFPLKYYEKAIGIIENENKWAQFFIFSEDEKVKAHFARLKKKNIQIVNIDVPDKDIIEWWLLAKCHHHILTNSTYSWWAAFAAAYDDKRIFVPEKSLYLNRENADIYRGIDEYGDEHYDNYYPADWERLPIHLNDLEL